MRRMVQRSEYRIVSYQRNWCDSAPTYCVGYVEFDAAGDVVSWDPFEPNSLDQDALREALSLVASAAIKPALAVNRDDSPSIKRDDERRRARACKRAP